ncbi:MAG TPA: ABC transporter permease, partial [Ignavibacteriaceae bacterium]|nr:ABC transporter permease [Ignavibacteriaceae bacterium]
MFRNYMKIAFRNLFKYKLYSFINILGLALGIGITILIYLYIKNDFSYDGFNKKGDRIYRVISQKYEKDGSAKGYDAYFPIPFGPDLKSEMPEIEEVIRFSTITTFVKGKKIVDENDILMADRPFFKTFTFNFKYGSAEKALDDPYSIVLTIDEAEKYFGKSNPVGKSIDVLLGDKYVALNITGVIEKIPSNSSLNFKFLVPYDLLRLFEWYREREHKYNSWNSPTWVLLKKNADVKNLESKMIGFWEKHMGDRFAAQR